MFCIDFTTKITNFFRIDILQVFFVLDISSTLFIINSLYCSITNMIINHFLSMNKTCVYEFTQKKLLEKN